MTSKRELSVTLTYDNGDIIAEIMDNESSMTTTFKGYIGADNGNVKWRKGVANEIYSWIELMADQDKEEN